ncbi:hypothetical protein R3379_22230 [Bacillus sp. BAU-SS-2023]|nr:hypothetical protein [Bacillus sp. BAU-SS-2023]
MDGENNLGYIVCFVNKNIERLFLENLIKNSNRNGSNIIIRSLENNINKTNISFLYKEIKKYFNIDECNVEVIYIHNKEYDVNENNKIKKQYKEICKLKNNNIINNIKEVTFEDKIEDWFVIDKLGVCKYLNCDWESSIKTLDYGNNEELFKMLFKRCSKPYTDRSQARLLIYLDFKLIYNAMKQNNKTITTFI